MSRTYEVTLTIHVLAETAEAAEDAAFGLAVSLEDQPAYDGFVRIDSAYPVTQAASGQEPE